ncbi:putative Ig domain-containing protein [Candidatus Spongiihabitans sp.]|uniref:putative Ig domain-containing protein n=1 Tax=Candidatus Spongiihabitans sp. TaxID=3101308 RepID=UPI003C7E64CC
MLTFERATPITPIIFPEAIGGFSDRRHDLSPSSSLTRLGLAFNPATRELSGTPILAGTGRFGDGFSFVYSVEDLRLNFVSRLVHITVLENGAIPAFVSLAFAAPLTDQTFTLGASVHLVLPDATGGTGAHPVFTYSLIGMLPRGLAFDSATPTSLHQGRTVTYQIHDAGSGGEQLQQQFTITVVERPHFTEAVLDQTYIAGVSITPQSCRKPAAASRP